MVTYLERIKAIVRINQPLYKIKDEQIWEMLESAKPIIFDGHFELLSEMHTDTFFRFAALSQLPQFVDTISDELLAGINQNTSIPKPITAVLGVASQGMFLAYDLAGKLGVRVVYAPINKDSGKPQQELIEGYTLSPDDNVLIVNDMTTTGNGIVILENLALEKDAKIAGICLFANRGLHEQKITHLQEKYGNRFRSIIDLNMDSWSRVNCKYCGVKPLIFSREINHLPIYSDEQEYNLYLKELDRMQV